MKKILLYVSILALSASIARAELTTDQVVTDFQAQGYTTIEVKRGLTQIKVEAVKDGQKVEVIYDIATGAVLKRETGVVEPGDDIRSGVTVRNRNQDFVRVVDGDDDDSSHSHSGSDDDSDHDANDDHGGSDDGADHDANDDHGGDNHGGNGGDDHGGSDHSGHGGGDDGDSDDD